MTKPKFRRVAIDKVESCCLFFIKGVRPLIVIIKGTGQALGITKQWLTPLCIYEYHIQHKHGRLFIIRRYRNVQFLNRIMLKTFI